MLFPGYTTSSCLPKSGGTVAIVRALQQIHAATHPGAMLERGEKPSTKATSPDAEVLFQILAAEAEDDRE
jgi:hypothetical protein